MTDKVVVESLLRLLEILTAWPVILALGIFIFRRPISAAVIILAVKLKQAGVGGTTWEFADILALEDTVEKGVAEYKNNPEELVKFVRTQISKATKLRTAAPNLAELNLRSCSILWVDDKPINNTYEASFIRQLGANITSARSTEEALALLGRDRFDLVISDMSRDEDGKANYYAGYELLEQVTKSYSNLPVIFYMGNVTRLDHTRSRSAFGAADNPSDLFSLVSRALQRAS